MSRDSFEKHLEKSWCQYVNKSTSTENIGMVRNDIRLWKLDIKQAGWGKN